MSLTTRLLTIAFALVLAGCAQTGPRPEEQAAESAAAEAVEQYKIGPGDVVRIDVWNNPEVSVTAPVRPDGQVSVPLAGDVQAGGRTPEQLAQVVEKGLGHYIRDPEVTAIVTELNSHEYLFRVRVTGAVEEPLSMPHREGMTVLDLVLEAGGMTDFASPGRAKLYRTENGKRETYPVDLDEILVEGDLETNYRLKPGDIVAVPERLF